MESIFNKNISYIWKGTIPKHYGSKSRTKSMKCVKRNIKTNTEH